MINNILIFTILFSICFIYSNSFKTPNDFLNVNKFKQNQIFPKLRLLHDDNSSPINTNFKNAKNEEIKENVIQKIEEPSEDLKILLEELKQLEEEYNESKLVLNKLNIEYEMAVEKDLKKGIQTERVAYINRMSHLEILIKDQKKQIKKLQQKGLIN